MPKVRKPRHLARGERLQIRLSPDELTAVDDFRKARRILRAVGNVSSFRGIEDEATLIIKRLAQVLSVRIQQPALQLSELGLTTRLLLQLEGNEAVLLREYLGRRRRAVHDVLTTFPPAGVSETGSGGEDNAPTAAPAAAEDEEGELSAAAGDVARLGEAFMPQLLELLALLHALLLLRFQDQTKFLCSNTKRHRQIVKM